MATSSPSAATTAHAPASAGRRRFALVRPGGAGLTALGLTIVVLVVAIAPLFYVIDLAFHEETQTGVTAVRSLAAFLDVFASAEYYQYLLSAVMLAAAVTAVSLTLGITLSVIMARTDLPGKGWFELLIIMPIFVSPFTALLSWINLASAKTGYLNVLYTRAMAFIGLDVPPLFNIWTFGGMVWVMALYFTPLAYLFTVGSFRSMDASLEEAARASGAGVWTTLSRVTLPMALPAILSCGLLIFVLAAEMYAIPGIIGANAGFTTLPWQIYKDTTAFPVRQAHAASAAIMLLLLTVAGVVLQNYVTRNADRYVTVAGKGFRGRLLPLGNWKWAVLTVFIVFVLCADVLPLIALIMSSLMKFTAPFLTAQNFTLNHYVALVTEPGMQRAITNTLILAVLSGVCTVGMGFLISFFELRRGGIAAKSLAFLGVLPVAVPGLIYGIGLLWLYVGTPNYGSIWILLLAYIAKFLPFAIIASRSGILQIHPELEQSARMSGATQLRASFHIVMPLVTPTLIAALFYVMISSVKELSASILLSNQNTLVLSVLSWQFVDNGSYQFGSAVGLLQTAIMIGIVVLTRLVFRVRMEQAISHG